MTLIQMIDKERLSNPDGIRSEVDSFFANKSYSDPLAFEGGGVVAMRVRERSGIDPVSSQRLGVLDRLSVNDASALDNPANLTASRMIYFGRGDGQEQVIINFNYDTGEVVVSGIAKDQFSGDPVEELLAGLRLIAENETF